MRDVFSSPWELSPADPDSFAMSLDAVAKISSRLRLRVALIRTYADQNLRDPALSVESIAAAFGITPRYVQMIFKAEGEPLSSYIRRRRLDGCRSDLVDSTSRERSVTTIAYDWGFNSTAHFARRFREQYGVSPRSLRRS